MNAHDNATTPPMPEARLLWRQGDILIQQCAALPQGCELLKGRVIARGEATGHAHRLSIGRGAKLFRAPQALPRSQRAQRPGLMYLEVTAPQCSIVHHEHAPITLEPGTYEIWRQREFDYVNRQFRIAGD